MNNTEPRGARGADPDSSSDSDIRQLEGFIASIVEVTQQRDRIALENCMGRVLLQLTDATMLTVYHLERREADMLAVPVTHLAEGLLVSTRRIPIKPFLLSTNAQLAERLRLPYPQNVPPETGDLAVELILPLRGSNGNVATFCRLEHARNDAATRRVLSMFLDFYTNFLTLLEDNERDALTGLLNRKAFDTRVARILASLRNPRDGALNVAAGRICIAALDIDNFKQVNDTFGHIYGDEVLLLFADLMKKTFRDIDLMFRFGGEEFVVLLADTDLVQAHLALERFRCAVETHRFPQLGKITVSIGASLLAADKPPRTTMDRADQALYFAKQNGRNQIRVYEELVQQGLLIPQDIQTGAIEMF